MQGQNRSGPIIEEIGILRGALKTLDRSLRRLTPLLSAGVALNGTLKQSGRRSPRLSPKARASLVLQGRYMGYMRQLNPRHKAQVRKIREAKGVRVAIRSAKDLAKG